ncbi:MAG: hypothetical protein ABEJ40_03030 [Haloarculaceae archaeon]
MDGNTDLSSDLRDSLREHRGQQSSSSGTIVLDSEEGYVGDEVTVRGRNLPASQEFHVIWHTVDGEWGVLEANKVIGPQYSPRTEGILTLTTDEDGKFDATFEVPTDYGGSHAIELQRPDGSSVARTEFEVRPWFEIDETEAELGDFFTVRGYGIGPNPVMNNYQVAWDNGTVGYMTGVMNNGTATAQIRAVGPPGKHDFRVWRSYRGFPFLQTPTQSPYGPVGGDRQVNWTVEVTEPESPPETAWTDPHLDEEPLPVHYPEIDEDTDAELDVTPSSGTPGTEVFITGKNFPPGEAVNLVWHRHEGKRIEGTPITPEPKYDVLPTVETDSDGSFRVEVEIQPDIGGTRPITAEVGGKSVAITGFMMQAEALDISPTQVAPGEKVEIKIQGVGWTLYENTIFFDVDNKMLGYVCGNAAEDPAGTIHTEIRAPWETGWHFVDVYPSVFEMGDEEPDFECKPHLSYLDNHPVRPLGAHHFAFEVVE